MLLAWRIWASALHNGGHPGLCRARTAQSVTHGSPVFPCFLSDGFGVFFFLMKSYRILQMVTDCHYLGTYLHPFLTTSQLRL
jgi:hypothetical protein